MAAKHKGEVSFAIRGGTLAGVLGGVVLALYGLAGALARHGDPWVPLKGAGALFMGARAMAPGPDATAVVVGLLSHFAVSIVWGILFGLLFYGLSKGATVVAGAFWGIVVWLGMYYVVLPIVGLGAVARAAPVGMAIFLHVLFGLAVGIGFLPWQLEARSPAGPTTPIGTRGPASGPPQ